SPVGSVKARGNDQVLGPGDPGAAGVAAGNVDHRRSRGSNRGGEGLIEGMKHIESWLRHGTVSFTSEPAPIARTRKSAFRRGFRRKNRQVLTAVAALSALRLPRQAGLTRTLCVAILSKSHDAKSFCNPRLGHGPDQGRAADR